MKKAAVVIGRFNPPTIGHYNLFQRVKSFILGDGKVHSISPQVFIVVVDGEKSSQDLSVNPLSAEERISILEKHNSTKDCKIIVAKTAIDGFNQVRKEGFEPTLIAGGDDRTKDYINILQKFNPEVELIEFSMKRTKIDPEKSEKILSVMKDQDTNLVSATLARHSAKTDNLEAFKMLTGLTGSLALATFNKIKQRVSK
jgi:Cytidylyltransferase-like